MAVHHSDREPQEGLLRSRREAAVGDGGDQKARQSGRRPLVEPPQGGAQGRVDAQCAKALPDVDEVGAERESGRPLPCRAAPAGRRCADAWPPGSLSRPCAHGVGPQDRAEAVAVDRAAPGRSGSSGSQIIVDAAGADRRWRSPPNPAISAIVDRVRAARQQRDDRQERRARPASSRCGARAGTAR